MTHCIRRDIVLEYEREIVGGLLHGKSDPRLVWWRHFLHERLRMIAVTCDVLRRQGHLFTTGPDDDTASWLLSAQANAELVLMAMERCNLWPSLGSARHEVFIECLERVGPVALACFRDTVTKLINECRRQESILALRRQLEVLESQHELTEVP